MHKAAALIFANLVKESLVGDTTSASVFARFVFLSAVSPPILFSKCT